MGVNQPRVRRPQRVAAQVQGCEVGQAPKREWQLLQCACVDACLCVAVVLPRRLVRPLFTLSSLHLNHLGNCGHTACMRLDNQRALQICSKGALPLALIWFLPRLREVSPVSASSCGGTQSSAACRVYGVQCIPFSSCCACKRCHLRLSALDIFSHV